MEKINLKIKLNSKNLFDDGEIIKYIKCLNTTCEYNQSKYCQKFTDKQLKNNIRCDERKW